MEKIYTLLVTKEEIEGIKEILNNNHVEDDNMDISKVFNVRGYELVYFIFVTDEKTFIDITKSVSGFRIF